MIKQLIFTTALLLSLITVHAQKLYIKAGAGQMLPLAGQTFTVNNWAYNGTVTYGASTGKINSFDVKSASFAAGTQINAGIGLMVGKHAALELNGIFGVKPKSFSGTVGYPVDANTYRTETYVLTANAPILLNPSLMLKTEGPISLYTRLGLLLPLSADMKGEFHGTVSQTGYLPGTYSGEQDYKTKFSVGATGSAGISVQLPEGFNLWAEGTFSSLSLYIKQKTYTKYMVNDVDKLNDIPADTKNITYSSSENSGNGNLPTSTVPFSAVGINIGISLDF